MIKQVFQNEHPRCSDGDPLRSAVFGPHPAAVIHAFGICFLPEIDKKKTIHTGDSAPAQRGRNKISKYIRDCKMGDERMFTTLDKKKRIAGPSVS